MDPFSITAGVAGLLSLSMQLQQILSKYTKSVKHAAAESYELATELAVLHSVLKQLERFIEQQAHSGHHFDQSSVLYMTTKSCHRRLNSLQSNLDAFMAATKPKPRLWKRSVKWPLEKEEHRETINALHNCLHVFHVSLSIAGW